MGAGHGHRAYYHEHSRVHRLPAQCKIVAHLSFVVVVVATPITAWWAFAGYAGLLGVAVVAARVPIRFVAPRLLVEAPVVAFCLVLPFVAAGSTVDVAGLALSAPGLLGAANVLVKATLGVVAAVLLAATTQPRDLLVGLERLRLPSLLVQTVAFMVRYLDVVTDELRRMRVARESRGFTARGPGSWGVLARSAGALFIRCYERGERVQLAMLSRGYGGRLPLVGTSPGRAADWALAGTLPAAAVTVALTATGGPW